MLSPKVLPTRFGHSGYLPFKRKLPEADAADGELAHITAPPPAPQTTIVNARAEDVHIQAFILGASNRLLLRIAIFLFDSTFGVIQSPFQLFRFVH